MTDIKVNKIIWDSVPAQDKDHITLHLRQFGVLQPGENIVADVGVPSPANLTELDSVITDKDRNVKALGIDWLCRYICVMSKRETGCLLYGQTISTCLETIASSRILNTSKGEGV